MLPDPLPSFQHIEFRLSRPDDCEAIVQLRCEALREPLNPWFGSTSLPARRSTTTRLRAKILELEAKSWRCRDRMISIIDHSQKAREAAETLVGVPDHDLYAPPPGFSRVLGPGRGTLVGFCYYAIEVNDSLLPGHGEDIGLADGDTTQNSFKQSHPLLSSVEGRLYALEASVLESFSTTGQMLGSFAARHLPDTVPGGSYMRELESSRKAHRDAVERRRVMNENMDWARWRNFGGTMPTTDRSQYPREPQHLSTEETLRWPPSPSAEQLAADVPDTQLPVYIYLHILCFADSSQGQGLGGHCLSHLARISQHLSNTLRTPPPPVYLESSRRGVQVYLKRGFNFLPHPCHIRDPENGGKLVVTLPTMLWQP
ncbi:hypothetical protein PYCC9005_003073 [Savitreella phatthalungensis]